MDAKQHVVVNLRGPKGSGKSTLVYKLLSEYGHTPVSDDLRPNARLAYVHQLPGNFFVLGNYDGGTAGSEGLAEEQLIALLRRYLERGMVFFENMKEIVLRYHEFSRELGPGRYVWAFLDTPVEQCVQNIYKRNGGKPFQEDKVRKQHRYYWNRFIPRVRELGEEVVVLDHGHAYEHLVWLLRSKGWDPVEATQASDQQIERLSSAAQGVQRTPHHDPKRGKPPSHAVPKSAATPHPEAAVWRNARMASGLSVAQLAQAVGVSKSRIYEIERGLYGSRPTTASGHLRARLLQVLAIEDPQPVVSAR